MKLHEDMFELISNRANTKFLVHELSFSMETCTYQVSESIELLPIDCLRDLGIKVVDDRTWSQHIHQVATVGKAAAALVLSAFKTRSRKVMLTLYDSLVRSHLEYCCPLWHSIHTKAGGDRKNIH